MKSFRILIFLILPIACIFVSCKSVPKNGKDYMYVMIYDYENKCVQNVSIFIDENLLGQSDINGRFFIPIKKEKTEHQIKLEKDGYEIIEEKIEFRADIVLYYKIASAFYYFTTAENCLDNNEIDLALDAIDKALNIEEKDEYLFLKSIILFEQNKIDSAKDVLLKIKSQIPNKVKKVFEENYED